MRAWQPESCPQSNFWAMPGMPPGAKEGRSRADGGGGGKTAARPAGSRGPCRAGRALVFLREQDGEDEARQRRVARIGRAVLQRGVVAVDPGAARGSGDVVCLS